MEHLEWIITAAGTVLAFIITLTTMIIKYAKSSKAKKIAQQTLAICNALIPYIEEAEKFVDFSGEEKKAYVMTKARQYVMNNKMKISDELISKIVEDYIDLTKEVNVRETISNSLTIPMRGRE